EDHGNVAAADFRHASARQAEQVHAFELNAATDDAGRRIREEPPDGKRRHRFARSAFAHDTHRAACRHLEAHIVEHTQRFLPRPELDREVLDLEKRARHSLVSGSSTSRMASPRRLKESTTPVSAAPAPMIGHGEPKRLLSPSRMMLPQLGLGGCVPMPRKLRLASMRMAEATQSVMSTMMGAEMLGTMWRKMMTG